MSSSPLFPVCDYTCRGGALYALRPDPPREVVLPLLVVTWLQCRLWRPPYEEWGVGLSKQRRDADLTRPDMMPSIFLLLLLNSS